MTTLTERPHAALLVVDVQRDVVARAVRRDAVVEAIAGLVDRARAAGTTVVWIRHGDEELVPGSEGWQIVPELVPDAGEALVEKGYGDAFEETTLEETLAKHGVGHLFVTGAQTDACIRGTLHGALTRGYDVTLVDDAHTTEDHSAYGAPAPELVIAHTNLYWTYETAPGRTAGTVSADAVDFGAAAARTPAPAG